MSTPRDATSYEKRRENEARILANIDVDAVWEHASYYCGVDCRPGYATCEETLVGLLAALSADGPVLIVEGEVVVLETQHTIEFSVDGWCIEHPVACRVGGLGLDCPWNRWAQRSLDGPPSAGVGRYVASGDPESDDVTLAREVETDE